MDLLLHFSQFGLKILTFQPPLFIKHVLPHTLFEDLLNFWKKMFPHSSTYSLCHQTHQYSFEFAFLMSAVFQESEIIQIGRCISLGFLRA